MEPIKPAIMLLPIWQELRGYVTPLAESSKSRGSFRLRKLPDDLLKRARRTYVKCGHPKCNKRMCIIRLHPGSDSWSIHPTGMKSKGHKRCAYGNEVKAQILALQLDVGQAVQSPRVQKAIEDGRQEKLQVKETDDGLELSFE